MRESSISDRFDEDILGQKEFTPGVLLFVHRGYVNCVTK